MKKVFLWLAVPLLIIILVILELSVRVISRISPSAKMYIDGALGDHPIIFGSLWTAIMVSVLCISFIEYEKNKTKSNLVKLITWLVTSAILLIYGLCRIW